VEDFKRVSGQQTPFSCVHVAMAWFCLLRGLRPCTKMMLERLSELCMVQREGQHTLLEAEGVRFQTLLDTPV
jgi:hypothetical protein